MLLITDKAKRFQENFTAEIIKTKRTDGKKIIFLVLSLLKASSENGSVRWRLCAFIFKEPPRPSLQERCSVLVFNIFEKYPWNCLLLLNLQAKDYNLHNIKIQESQTLTYYGLQVINIQKRHR